MKLNMAKRAAMLAASLILMLLTTGSASTAMTPLPNPVIVFMGQEFYEANGKQWTRYRYNVFNSEVYPNELFAAAPDLPPCGQNTKSARAWVDIFDSSGKRLNGFCALKDRNGLEKLWFAVERDALPPSWIYIEISDRKTNEKYKSNLAETTE